MRLHNDALVCLCCGGTMMSRRPDAIWCSPGCKLKGNRIIKAEAAAGSPVSSVADLLREKMVMGVAPAKRQEKKRLRQKKRRR